MLRRSRPKRDRCLVVDITDTHAGHQLGLLNPETRLVRHDADTGEAEFWTPPMTATQERLWRIYMDALVAIEDWAGVPDFVRASLWRARFSSFLWHETLVWSTRGKRAACATEASGPLALLWQASRLRYCGA